MGATVAVGAYEHGWYRTAAGGTATLGRWLAVVCLVLSACAATSPAAAQVETYCNGLKPETVAEHRTKPSPFDVEVSSDKLPGDGAAWITFTDNAFANFSAAKFCVRGFWRLRDVAGDSYLPVSIQEIYLVDKSKPPQVKVVFGVDPVASQKSRLSHNAEYVFIGRLDTTPSTPANAAASQIDFAYVEKTRVTDPKVSKCLAILFVIALYLSLAAITYQSSELSDLKNVKWFAFLFSPIRLTAGTFGEASISQLQIVLFTFITAGLLFYLWLRTGLLGNISPDLLSLLGISAIGAVGAKFTAVLKSDLDKDLNRYLIIKRWFRWPPAKSIESATFKQLLLTGGRLDVYKFQVAVFTLIVAAYVVSSGANDLGEVKISDTMLYLIGISQGVYVAGKAISDRKGQLEEALKAMRDSENSVIALTRQLADAADPAAPALEPVRKSLQTKTADYKIAAKTASELFAELYAVEPVAADIDTRGPVERVGTGTGACRTSHVEHAPVGVEHRLLHRLRDGRMREDGVHQLFFGGLEIHRDHIALDQLGDFRADHVRA